MNGKVLPSHRDEMHVILSYMAWLSQGVPTGVSVERRGFERITPDRAPDTEQGKALYAAKCLACHGLDGRGVTGPNGAYVFPALWATTLQRT